MRLAALLLLGVLGAPAGGAGGEAPLARAQELIDAGRGEEALAVALPLCEREQPDPAALLVCSTARLMSGELEAGRRDLERALALDPGLRQGWLNRAALDLAERRLDGALAALERARDLDPAAPDNDLNLGAVRVLKGELEAANAHFARYLDANATSAEAFYLVASNYALAGYHALALENLRAAVGLDERTRLRARTDANFAELAATAPFREFLETDPHVPAAGAYQARREYGVAYDAEDGRLLGAVLDALRAAGIPFEPLVEVASAWALVWGEVRIKVSARGTTGVVEVSAPAGRLTPAQWRDLTERFFKELAARLGTGYS